MEIDTASLLPVEKREMTELEEKLLKAYQEKHPEVKDRDTLVKVINAASSQTKVGIKPSKQKA